MKLIQSKKMSLPTVYLVESDEDFKVIPLGVPFIRGSLKDYDSIVMLLEFDILLKQAKASGLPFNWQHILEKNGYKDIYFHGKAHSFFEKGIEKDEYEGETVDSEKSISIDTITREASYQVNIELLKELKVIPSWFSKTIEENIRVNILNSLTFNPNLYNKKLGLPTGDIEMTSPERNLIINDISGSIPRSVSNSILLLSKTMCEQFYADLLITGSKSTLYDYTEVGNLNVSEIYDENGMDNDQVWFKKLVSEDRKYNNAIVFGDNHSPSMKWTNEFNRGTSFISREKGKEICKWKINKIFSFHVTSNVTLAGYADWFDTENIEFMENWVEDLN